MKQILFILSLLILTPGLFAQKLKKSERIAIEDLSQTVYFLASDDLQGRRAGTEGEIKAANYLTEKFKSIGLLPKGENGSYTQVFDIHEGRHILPSSFLKLNENTVDSADYFPLSFGGDGSAEVSLSPAIREDNEPWLADISPLLEKNKNNPHFDLEQSLKDEVSTYKEKGATAVIFYTSGTFDPELSFNGKSKQGRLDIPVIYIAQPVARKYIPSNEEFISISFNIATGERERTGRNVIGYIDNGAPTTIVIGAHFDHLGYGEDHNSLWAGKPAIHHGADDNASGVALVVETAKQLKELSDKKKSDFKNSNYLLMCFSGEELGLLGSKYFTDHPTIPLESVNFMINCDMVGRLNGQTKNITIGGYGTSPYWSSLPKQTKFMNVSFDSSGMGPSDHTSFYLKNIPVLFFFTGTHTDYHKPSDVADKINYTGELRIIQYIMDVVANANKTEKLTFLKTREPETGDRPTFTVSLGIMPDYANTDKGLKIDGVISGKVADKAGLKTGDTITKIGDFKVADIYDYMKALAHFKKGDKTTIEFESGSQVRTVNIEF